VFPLFPNPRKRRRSAREREREREKMSSTDAHRIAFSRFHAFVRVCVQTYSLARSSVGRRENPHRVRLFPSLSRARFRSLSTDDFVDSLPSPGAVASRVSHQPRTRSSRFLPLARSSRFRYRCCYCCCYFHPCRRALLETRAWRAAAPPSALSPCDIPSTFSILIYTCSSLLSPSVRARARKETDERRTEREEGIVGERRKRGPKKCKRVEREREREKVEKEIFAAPANTPNTSP